VRKKKKRGLTLRPDACPDGMAEQCPRGRLDATQGSLHHSTAGSTTNGASTGVLTHTCSSRRSTAGVEEEAGEASHRGCSDAADPEGRDHPDLLGEEAADETTWWSW
jgi:hypothetical protein